MNVKWLAWALFSAVFAGLAAMLAKAGIKGIDPNIATGIRTVIILVFVWSIALFKGFESLRQATTRTWVFLVLSGLATEASSLCYFRAFQLGMASMVAPIDELSVVIAMLLAMMFLGEVLSWRHWLGGVPIVSGAVVVAFAPRPPCKPCTRYRWFIGNQIT